MLTRRFFVAGTGAALLLPPLPALALTANGASQLVNSLVGDINTVIASGKGENAMFRDFERIFARYSDTSYIAAYAMGVDGRRASNGQKRAFSKAFQGYISRKYGKRFREFIGGRLEVNDVRQVKNWYEVRTTAFLRGESPFTVTFHVSDRSGLAGTWLHRLSWSPDGRRLAFSNGTGHQPGVASAKDGSVLARVDIVAGRMAETFAVGWASDTPFLPGFHVESMIRIGGTNESIETGPGFRARGFELMNSQDILLLLDEGLTRFDPVARRVIWQR